MVKLLIKYKDSKVCTYKSFISYKQALEYIQLNFNLFESFNIKEEK